MVRLYLDDGYPESDEFEGNCVYFDERDPRSIGEVQERLRQLGREEIALWIGELFKGGPEGCGARIRRSWLLWRAVDERVGGKPEGATHRR